MTTDADLITTRNLIDTDIGPLRRLTGILDSMPKDTQTYGEGESARASTRVTLNFRDIDVVETVEPYNFPTYSARPIGLSNKKKSRWGVFGDSLNKILDSQYTAEQLDPMNPNYLKPQDRMDIKACIGKRLGIVMADGEGGRPQTPLLYDGRKGVEKDVPTPSWTVYSVEGIGVIGGGGNNPIELAMQMLDNKSMSDFNQAALANPVIRGDANLLQSISLPVSAPSSFTNTMIATGQFTKDAQEVFHKVIYDTGSVAPPAQV